MSVVKAARQYVRTTYPEADWPHIRDVVNTAIRLARQENADQEIVTLAALFHDISRTLTGVPNHNIESAHMARVWLSAHQYPEARIQRVCGAIIAHMRPMPADTPTPLPIESRILYDADKISRAQGLGLISALVRLGSPVTWEGLTYPELETAIAQGRAVTQEAFDTLYTESARQAARDGLDRAITFCDGLLSLDVFKEGD